MMNDYGKTEKSNTILFLKLDVRFYCTGNEISLLKLESIPLHVNRHTREAEV
jgi:hypothetical protein